MFFFFLLDTSVWLRITYEQDIAFFLFVFAFSSITFDFLLSFFQKLLLYSDPFLHEVTSQFSYQFD